MATFSSLSETPSRRTEPTDRRKQSYQKRANRNLFQEDSDQGASFRKSSPWITRINDDLEVSPIQLLRSRDVAAHEFVNFVTILGPARQGKSFLMNCLLGEDVFSMADTMGVCTKGVQIANVVQRVKNESCALFVDTEGQGDEDVDSDTTLLTPVLLLSKVILFNWKGGLQKNQILSELAILVEVGKCVSSNVINDETSKFGHLHIVLRDFHFQGTTKEAYNMIFEQEEKRGEKVRDRNKIREKLLSSFESIDISIFPAPCDTSNDELRDLHLRQTSQEFQESVKQLKDKVLHQMSRPRYFGSTIVCPGNADSLVEKFIEELQTGDVVHVKSVVCQLQRDIVIDAKRGFEESLIEAFKEIDVPMRNGIEELLTRKRDELLKEFEESTANVDFETVYRDEVLEELEEFSDRELETKRRENRFAVQSMEAEQKAILAEAAEKFRSEFENALKRGEGNSEKAREDFEIQRERLVGEFLESTDELDWIVQLAKEELDRLVSWASEKLDEKVKAMRKEEEYLEKSEQHVRLSRAADDFRSGVENELQRSRQASAQRLREDFKVQLERLVKAFKNNIHGLHLISELAKEELGKLKRWASKKIEEKVEVVEEAELLRQREERRAREQALFEAPSQSHYLSFQPAYPSFSPPSTPQSTSGLKYYKGGQFTPGGGRAPKGGCYMSPSIGSTYRSSGSSSSSSGGATFYKGGQFTPGGGRAPKGGCWK